jgi:hypothetical protein
MTWHIFSDLDFSFLQIDTCVTAQEKGDSLASLFINDLLQQGIRYVTFDKVLSFGKCLLKSL